MHPYRPKEAPANQRFRIWCEDWHNADQPTMYEFRYQRTAERRTNSLPLLNPTSMEVNELSNILLPVGLKEQDYRIDMVVMIRNKYNQFVEYTDKDFFAKVIYLFSVCLNSVKT